MDSSVFINACHPIDESTSEDLTCPAKHYTRTQSPPQYYYVDFSISRNYEASENNPLEQPPFRQDFATDVGCLGHAIQKIFLDVWCSSSLSHFTPHFYKQRYSGVKFLNGLVSDMIHEDPTQRPNMDVVVSRFKDLRRSLSARKLRSRVVHVDKNYFVGFIPHWVHRIQYIMHKIPPTRTPIS